MTTRLTICTAARVELQETTEGFWLNTELQAWYDDANSKIVQRTKQESTATITMVSGTESYSLPTDFFLARRVEIQTTAGSASSWMFLNPVGIDSRDPGDPSDTTTQMGTPYGWYIYGNKIYFTPIPNGAFSGTLYYYIKATKSTSDSDTPSYPLGVMQQDVDTAIKKFICAEALRKRQDGAYQTYASDWNAALAEFAQTAAERGSATPLTVVNDWADE